jgi:ectoine hydroxylase-related dioxygenase (phytanoyl-CoA dioxygenase family)
MLFFGNCGTPQPSIQLKFMNTRTGSLSESQIQAYDEEGYLVLPKLLNDRDLTPARQAMEKKVEIIAQQLLADGLIRDALPGLPFESRLADLFRGLRDSDFMKYGRSWRDRLPGYFDLMSNPKILDAVESLIGAEIFANPVYNTRPKVPGVAAGAVPWHQDKSYWPDANSNPVITVWIPLVDSNQENGCLHVWPRTHRAQVLSFHAETYSGTGYTEIDDQHLTHARNEAVALPLEAGGAILFNDRCIHMSTPNRSRTVRWSVDLRYQPTDQDRMPQHGAGFLARSRTNPERVAKLDDWLANRPEHDDSSAAHY